MGRALFSVSHPISKPPTVQIHTEPEPQPQTQYENWSRYNAFDPDSDEFFENAVYEAVVPADGFTQIAADQRDQSARVADRDRQNASVGVGAGIEAEMDMDASLWYYDTVIRGAVPMVREGNVDTRYIPAPPPDQPLTFRQRQALATIARRTRSASVSSLGSPPLPPLVPIDQALLREFGAEGRAPVSSWMVSPTVRLSRGTTTRPRLETRPSMDGDDSSPDSSAPATPNPEAMSSSQLWTENTSLSRDVGASPLPPASQLPFIPPDIRPPENTSAPRNLPPVSALPITYVPLINIDSLSETRRRTSISEQQRRLSLSDRRPSVSEQQRHNGGGPQPERRAVAVPRRSMGNGIFGLGYAPSSAGNVGSGPLPNPSARISHTWQSASPPAYHPIPALRVGAAQDLVI